MAKVNVKAIEIDEEGKLWYDKERIETAFGIDIISFGIGEKNGKKFLILNPWGETIKEVIKDVDSEEGRIEG